MPLVNRRRVKTTRKNYQGLHLEKGYCGGLVVLGRVVPVPVPVRPGVVDFGAAFPAAGCGGTPDFALYASTTALVMSVAGLAHNTGEFC